MSHYMLLSGLLYFMQIGHPKTQILAMIHFLYKYLNPVPKQWCSFCALKALDYVGHVTLAKRIKLQHSASENAAVFYYVCWNSRLLITTFFTPPPPPVVEHSALFYPMSSSSLCFPRVIFVSLLCCHHSLLFFFFNNFY